MYIPEFECKFTIFAVILQKKMQKRQSDVDYAQGVCCGVPF